MAKYTMTIRKKDSTDGKPKYVFVYMEDPFVGANTWKIDMPNDWIGTGQGEYKRVGFNFDALEFRDGPWEDGKTRMQFSNINYPGDCQQKALKTGGGVYASAYNRWAASKLEWSNRNIVEDEW